MALSPLVPHRVKPSTTWQGLQGLDYRGFARDGEMGEGAGGSSWEKREVFRATKMHYELPRKSVRRRIPIGRSTSNLSSFFKITKKPP